MFPVHFQDSLWRMITPQRCCSLCQSLLFCATEYLENRMGLTITSVWRVLVYDIENVLDEVTARPDRNQE